MDHELEIRENKEITMETTIDDDKEPPSVDTSETETISIDGDRMSVKSQDSLPTPKKPSSGGSTPADKRSVTPPPSGSKTTSGSQTSTSKSGRSVNDLLAHQNMHPNRPNRPGIIWQINGKLEAMDFQKKWYPARIVDMDDTDNTALIHFDGWNQRYDEWVSMDSERLRPLTRTSGRKDKKMTKKSSAKLEHKIGDNVFAKWTDCRMYAGTIVGITPNESYEVLFYDGFKKTVQPINVKSMPLQVQKEYAVAGMLPHPSTKPHQKLQMLEKKAASDEYKRAFKQTKLEKKAPRAGGQSSDEVTPSTHKSPSIVSSTDSASPQTIKSSKLKLNKLKRQHKGSVVCKPIEDKVPVKKSKLLVGGKFQVKKIKKHLGRFDIKDMPIRIKNSSAENKEKSKRKQCVLHMKSRSVQGSGEGSRKRKKTYKPNSSKKLFSEPDSASSQRSKVIHSKSEPVDNSTPTKDDQTDDPTTSTQYALSQAVRKEEDLSDDDIALAQLIKSPTAPSSNSQQKTMSTASLSYNSSKVVKQTKPAVPGCDQNQEVCCAELPKKAFQTTPEQKYTCPFENCTKSFRKMGLVEYHVKYYHTEDGNVVRPLPPRKRRKTSSICSLDSETSFPIKQTKLVPPTKKRKEGALPVTQNSETANDTTVAPSEERFKCELTEETLVTGSVGNDLKNTPVTAVDNSEVTGDVNSDCLSKDEVVNCICQLNEENGLMIQCDMCLCWQHALCMELTEETLPSKYICYICLNPPGIRDSARYRFDQDWLKQGTMAKFNFLPEDPYHKQKASIMLATHNLISDVHGVNNMLHSLKCQLHANKVKNHPELQFWTRNWDIVMADSKLNEALSREEQQIGSRSGNVSDIDKLAVEKDSQSINQFMINRGQNSTEMKYGKSNIKQEVCEQESLMKQDVTEGSSHFTTDYTRNASQTSTASDCSQIKQEETFPIKQQVADEPHVKQSENGKLDLCNLEKNINEEKTSTECCSTRKDSLQGLHGTQTPSEGQLLSSKLATSTSNNREISKVQNLDDKVMKECDIPISGESHSVGSLVPVASGNNSLLSLNEEILGQSDAKTRETYDLVRVREPFVGCEQNMLQHIAYMQDNVQSRLDMIEEQISVLENADDDGNGNGIQESDVLSDLPRVKKAIHQILNDLFKVKCMALYR